MLDAKQHQGKFGEDYVRVLASAAGLIVLKDDLGTPIYMASLITDTTAQREAEGQLRLFRWFAESAQVGLGIADFDYNVPSWKPEVQYSSGVLRISQPNSHSSSFGNTKYEWDLRLNNEIPTDLTARVGGGEARLDLGTLSLRSLKIEIGAGELRLSQDELAELRLA